jgi:hypothetical protein
VSDSFRSIQRQHSACVTLSVIGKFGVSIENTMKAVPGRVLPPPTIQYGQPANYFAGTVGAWNMEVRTQDSLFSRREQQFPQYSA